MDRRIDTKRIAEKILLILTNINPNLFNEYELKLFNYLIEDRFIDSLLPDNLKLYKKYYRKYQYGKKYFSDHPLSIREINELDSVWYQLKSEASSIITIEEISPVEADEKRVEAYKKKMEVYTKTLFQVFKILRYYLTELFDNTFILINDPNIRSNRLALLRITKNLIDKTKIDFTISNLIASVVDIRIDRSLNLVFMNSRLEALREFNNFHGADILTGTYKRLNHFCSEQN